MSKPEAPDEEILLVEDDAVTRTVLEKLLLQKGYEVATAADGKEALTLFNRHRYPVVITDLYMPELSGVELIEKLEEQKNPPVMMVVSGENDVSTVIDIMKKDVYDYIIKPVDRNDFIFKAEKALELARMRHMTQKVMKEREILHAQKTDWNAWKDAILRKKFENLDQNLFANLKTAFTQGAGFGGLISLVPFMTMQAEEEGGFYKVPKDMVDLISQNAGIARDALEEFDEIGQIINARFKFEQMGVDEIYHFVDEVNQNVSKYAEVKSHQVTIPEVSFEFIDRVLLIHRKHLKRAFRELFINAFKFSEPETHIIVLFDNEKNNLKISFLSKPAENSLGERGISENYQKAVFEPFYRLNTTVDEQYETLDFGIGLTMVDRIIRKHNGRVSIRNFIDYSNINTPRELKVSVDITLPLYRQDAPEVIEALRDD